MILELDAAYFDGRTSERHVVRLRADAAVLTIVKRGETLASWPWSDINRADAPPEKLRLRCRTAAALALLEFADDDLGRALVTLCPRANTGESETHSTLRIVGWSIAAGLSIIALVWFGVPFAADRLAPLTPPAFENRIGQMVENQALNVFGGEACVAPQGVEALTKLASKLGAQAGVKSPLHLRVVRSKIINAVALPGNRIMVMRGLIDSVRTPDELAGVLAHELGHVRNHDGMRKLIQTGGTSFLAGLLFGDVTGAGAAVFAARELFGASYSREAETRADATAIEIMRGLGRSPAPLGVFLVRVSAGHEQAEQALALISSHPLTEQRLAALEAGKGESGGPDLLQPEEWNAIKSICGH